MKKTAGLGVAVLVVVFLAWAAALGAEGVAIVGASVSRADLDAKAAGDALAAQLKAKLDGTKPALTFLATTFDPAGCQVVVDALAGLADKSAVFGVAGCPTPVDLAASPRRGPQENAAVALAFVGKGLDVQAASVATPAEVTQASVKEATAALLKDLKPADKKGNLLVLLADLDQGKGKEEQPLWAVQAARDALKVPVTGCAGPSLAMVYQGTASAKRLVAVLLSGEFTVGQAMAFPRMDPLAELAIGRAGEAAGAAPLGALVFAGTSSSPTAGQEIRKVLGDGTPALVACAPGQFGSVFPVDPPSAFNGPNISVTVIGSAAGAPKAAATEMQAAPAPSPALAFAAAWIGKEDAGVRVPEQRGELLATRLLAEMEKQKQKPKLVLVSGDARLVGDIAPGIGKHIDPSIVVPVMQWRAPAVTNEPLAPAGALALGGDGFSARIVREKFPPERTADEAKETGRNRPDDYYILGQRLAKALDVKPDDKARLLLVYSPGHVTVASVIKGVESVIGNKVPMLGGCAFKGREELGGLAVLLCGDFRVATTTYITLPGSVERLTGSTGLLNEGVRGLRAAGGVPRLALFAPCTSAYVNDTGNFLDVLSRFSGYRLSCWGTNALSGEIGSLPGEKPAGFAGSCCVAVLGEAKE